ncbi:hypothetical protein [Rhodococcus wratislaviensis]|uniref:hypothetical protein n=1 Tax=Rhodococcus wratislaviensis TaxID=44752 RepID=UPI00365E70AB
MPALIPPTLTAPTPGTALVMEVGLVFSRPGIGPKGGGRHGGIPLSVGPTTTLFAVTTAPGCGCRTPIGCSGTPRS